MSGAAPAARRAFRGPGLLFCPGDRPERFAKAADRADTVILDLEDAVGPEGKAEGRDAVVAALSDLDPDRTMVRVNAPGTSWHEDDLRALAAHPDTTVMLPMAEQVTAVESLAPHPVVVLCETARGVLAAPRLAAAGGCVGVMWGSEDLLTDLGGRHGRAPGGGHPPALEQARIRVLYAARAAAVVPVDTVLVDIDDLRALEADSIAAAAAGFEAKACIHPSQVTVVRQAFLPTAEEVARAEELLSAAEGRSGVFSLGGQMIDAPVLARARELLRRADRPNGDPGDAS